MVEEVRNNREYNSLPCLLGDVGDGGGQMGLATAIAAPENEPAQRILGVVARDIVGLAHAWQRYIERFECLVTERIEIRDGAQVEAVALFDLLLFALAANRLPERRIAHRHIQPHIARAMAERTAPRRACLAG